jgi:spermidine/putrescine-binding protein
MKKLKNSMLAIALLAGISGAFITKAAQASKRVDTLYNWTGASNAPQNPGAQLNDATVATANANYGCNTGTNICATGTKVSGPGPASATIFFH